MEYANYALRFLLELAALAALVFWGFEEFGGVLQWVIGLGAPLVAANCLSSLASVTFEFSNCTRARSSSVVMRSTSVVDPVRGRRGGRRTGVVRP